MTRKRGPTTKRSPPSEDLAGFACPNEDCGDFNQFAAGNLSVCERMGKDHRIRRLYCKSCGHRFSEREGSLMAKTKLPEETVVRIIKCLVHGCSLEAAADICDVTQRTVQSLLDKAGRRADDFHRLQLEKLTEPLGVVELDELHGRSAPPKKGGPAKKLAPIARVAVSDVARAALGFMRHWWLRRDS